jgi:hypothetical protein
MLVLPPGSFHPVSFYQHYALLRLNRLGFAAVELEIPGNQAAFVICASRFLFSKINYQHKSQLPTHMK